MLQNSWTLDRVTRLAVLGRFTMDELYAFVGARGRDRAALRAGAISIPVALNLQRIEDYVIHRRIGVHPKIRPEDAVLVKVLNREPEKANELC